ncbi:MAG: hypothetical protein QQN55_01170 [Nitrosopumilus sp.]
MSRLFSKRGRKSNYLKSLNSPQWNIVKRRVRIRDNFTCIIHGCGKQANLETHHITYMVFGFSIVGEEINYLEWMATLCEDCHHEVHKKKNHPLNPKNPFRINVFKYKELK